MRTQIALLVSCLLILTSVALGQSFIYEKSIAGEPAPYPIAVDANGGIYYGTFNGASSGAYYIADPSPYRLMDTYKAIGRALGIPVQPKFYSSIFHAPLLYPLANRMMQGFRFRRPELHMAWEWSKNLCCDVGKSIADLGFSPLHNFETSINKEIDRLQTTENNFA